MFKRISIIEKILDFNEIILSLKEELKENVIETEKIRSEIDTLNDVHDVIKKNLQKSEESKKTELDLLKRERFSFIELMRSKNSKIKKLSIPAFNYIDEMITRCEKIGREFYQLLEKFDGTTEGFLEIKQKEIIYHNLMLSIDNQLNVAELCIKGTLDTLESRCNSSKNS